MVQNPSIFGMLLTPDLYFLEGDFMNNVTISNNYVSAPCVAFSNPRPLAANWCSPAAVWWLGCASPSAAPVSMMS